MKLHTMKPAEGATFTRLQMLCLKQNMLLLI